MWQNFEGYIKRTFQDFVIPFNWNFQLDFWTFWRLSWIICNFLNINTINGWQDFWRVYIRKILRFLSWDFMAIQLTLRIKWKQLWFKNKTLITLRCNIPLIWVLFEENFHTFALSFGAIWRTYILKVFSHCPNLKMWQFSKREDNEQHSFLFRLCGKGILYPTIPHIYSSVGYCIVYSRLGLPQPSDW